MKKCIKCGLLKNNLDFYKNRNGRLTTCKKCFCNRYSIYKDKYGIGSRTISTFGLKLALEVYDRAKRKCEKCGEENDLTIHHKDGKGRHNQERGLAVNNTSENLIVLCRKCHGSIHGKESWKNRK